MPFTQVNENTVADDQGNTYFMPFPGQGAPPGLTPPSGASLPPGNPVPLPPIPGPPGAIPEQLPSDAPQPQDPYAPAGPGPGSKDFAAPLQAQPGVKPTPASRDAQMTGDLPSFSAGGGVAKTDEDYAKMAGGLAKGETETAKATAVANAIRAQGEIEKMKTQAAMVMDTADQYEKHANQIMADSKSRWDDWKKRNDQAAATLIDPRHAFKDGGSLSRTNWALYFLGAGLQGGDSVDKGMQMVNKFINDDINMQKMNIENKRKGLDEEAGAIKEQDKLGKDQLAEWYFAKNLRLQAVGQSLDAKIAEMGQPAAAAAGLLASRDAINKELLKNQEHVGNHFFEDGQRKAKEAHDIYLERLKSQLKQSDELFAHGLSKDKNDTLPTNTQLGLQMVDKNTGRVVPGGQIPLKVKGEKAVEAGQILTNANEEASQLRDIQNELKTMSSADLVRGGTPKFKSMVTDMMQARAVRDNGHRISDADIPRAAQEEFGLIMADSIAKNAADASRRVGPYKEGLDKAITEQLKNLSTKTVNKLHPYIDSDTAQKFDINYNIQDTHVHDTSTKADDLNTAIIKASGGANVDDLLAPGPRKPVASVDEATPDKLPEYEKEKTAGRGVGGGLPRISQADENVVNQATAAFSTGTADDVLKIASAYLREKSLSPETKYEIKMESLDALKRATEKEHAVLEEATKRYKLQHRISTGDPEADEKLEATTDEAGNNTQEFQKYLNSGVVDEMRRRAGLEPRKK